MVVGVGGEGLRPRAIGPAGINARSHAVRTRWVSEPTEHLLAGRGPDGDVLEDFAIVAFKACSQLHLGVGRRWLIRTRAGIAEPSASRHQSFGRSLLGSIIPR